jgi:glycosyltransferase involved in cell wall biosynthesis
LRLRVPLVLDHRDSWIMDPQSPPSTALHRWLAARLEARIIESSAAVVGVNKRIARELAVRYPAARQKITTIYNGFDPEDFTALPPVASAFRRLSSIVSFVGSPEGNKNPLPVV